MIKRQELTDPKSCMSRAADDEMTFVLLGRDVAAAPTVRFWAERRVELGKNCWDDPQIVEAMKCADVMEATARAKAAGDPGALRLAAARLAAVVRDRFAGLEIVALVPGELRAAVEAVEAAVSK